MNNIESRKPVQLPLWDISTRIQGRNQTYPELHHQRTQDVHNQARALKKSSVSLKKPVSKNGSVT